MFLLLYCYASLEGLIIAQKLGIVWHITSLYSHVDKYNHCVTAMGWNTQFMCLKHHYQKCFSTFSTAYKLIKSNTSKTLQIPGHIFFWNWSRNSYLFHSVLVQCIEGGVLWLWTSTCNHIDKHMQVFHEIKCLYHQAK